MTLTVEQVAQQLLQKQTLSSNNLGLDLGESHLIVRSNSKFLLEKLRNYFAHLVIDIKQAPLEVIAIQSKALDLPYSFIDWKREEGKTGRKDAYFDFEKGRLIKKVRTGMVFLQSEQYAIAAGDCLKYDNQVINFINAQYMTWLQHRQWLICHAAALVSNNKALAMAGFSGGGKSTLMLHLLSSTNGQYLTNDRLFIKAENQSINAIGIGKLPRINPGTIVNNPKLLSLLSLEEQQTYSAMPKNELWEIEKKYDVDIEAVYGKNKIVQKAPLAGFLILNWQRDSCEPLDVRQVNLRERGDLLKALMKSPGPFYQYPNGEFLSNDEKLNSKVYSDLLDNIPVYEVRGEINFSLLEDYCIKQLL